MIRSNILYCLLKNEVGELPWLLECCAGVRGAETCTWRKNGVDETIMRMQYRRRRNEIRKGTFGRDMFI